MPTLELLGNVGLEIEIVYQRQHRKRKPTARRTMLRGHTQGVRKYRLVYRVLSDRGANAATTDWAKVWEFYEARRMDGQPFDVANVLEGGTLSMRFADYELTAEQFNSRLYSIDGVNLIEHRPATLTAG